MAFMVTIVTCRAQRWKGATPVHRGPHGWHWFRYGLHKEYLGSCAGWPKP